jgi:hypothetical protein
MPKRKGGLGFPLSPKGEIASGENGLPAKLDANQLLQDWKGAGITAEGQRLQIRAMLSHSKPMVLAMAEQVGNPQKGPSRNGAASGSIQDEDDRREAIKHIVQLAKLMGDDYWYYEKRIADALGLKPTELPDRPKKKAGKDKNGDEKATPRAGGWIHGHLVELLYDAEKDRTSFAVRYPDGRIEEGLEHVTIEDQKYVPIPPNALIRTVDDSAVVLLPSALGEQLQDHELVAVLQAHNYKYFDFGAESFFEELTPLWEMFTYIYDGFREVSYLRGLGDLGTGKTRWLKTIGKCCYRPVYISGGASAASIYHLLHEYRGTLVLNEADFKDDSDEASIIAKILNGGTERGEGITRMRKDAGGNFEVESYNVFGPKVIAMRKDYDDRAIASRCLTMNMVPFMPAPRIPQSMPKEFDQECRDIRNLLTTWRMHRAQPDFDVNPNEADRSLEPRLNQITMGLMSTVSSEPMKEKIRLFLRDYNDRTRADRKESKTARVIEGLVLANAWGPASSHPSDEKRVYLKDVAYAVNQLIDVMRRKMGEDEEEEQEFTTKEGRTIKKKSQRMTSRSVSGILKKQCQLRVQETTDGTDAYRGTNEVIWDQERIRGLCERWGVTWTERGSVERPMQLKPEPPGITQAREDWKNTEFRAPEGE